MIQLELRPSLRLVTQVAALERFAGRWDRLSLISAVASPELEEIAVREASYAALALDVSAPHSSVIFKDILEQNGIDEAHLDEKLPAAARDQVERFVARHASDLELSLPGLLAMFEGLTSPGRPLLASFDESSLEARLGIALRSQVAYVSLPGQRSGIDETLFATVSPFLVRNKLSELIDWTRTELKRGVYHPLFVVGIFHLLFLQIFPFQRANHQLSTLVVWHLLKANGFGFVRFSHFAPVLQARVSVYAASLRQAERTANTTWSSINIWLEFFLDALFASTERLSVLTESTEKNLGMSVVQKKILEVVRHSGRATREQIVTETGINLSTVKYNLSVLATRGHLSREGGGRSTSYKAV